ncbi:uncharacterized protein CCOS01_13222 [Colletotrichum costaricense]|uniref:Uncharacterized protein n=1 Tax=Colletotrichum costaricense TaxID=1209916 RepID=A0AAJ0DV48_9PEZI|nr:uncharacterized protein CCOS01_13222 [Colletotrichum costaricense]KAK1515029.1 hypothetical protein CCOS01_13222 [Colletotrichum costaricense]
MMSRAGATRWNMGSATSISILISISIGLLEVWKERREMDGDGRGKEGTGRGRDWQVPPCVTRKERGWTGRSLVWKAGRRHSRPLLRRASQIPRRLIIILCLLCLLFVASSKLFSKSEEERHCHRGILQRCPTMESDPSLCVVSRKSCRSQTPLRSVSSACSACTSCRNAQHRHSHPTTTTHSMPVESSPANPKLANHIEPYIRDQSRPHPPIHLHSFLSPERPQSPIARLSVYRV